MLGESSVAGHDDCMAILQQAERHMHADKAGCAADQNGIKRGYSDQ